VTVDLLHNHAHLHHAWKRHDGLGECPPGLSIMLRLLAAS